MSRLRVMLGSLLMVASGALVHAADAPLFGIAVHGGAGAISASDMSLEQERLYRLGLATALDAGYAVLRNGGTSLDAVTAAVRILEDDPLFNAGRGAVLTDQGTAELDAAVMEGAALRAGSVAGVRHVKNPIDLARLVMEKSPHVMLVGSGAERFALAQGLTLVPNEYFRTGERQRQLERALHERRTSSTRKAGTGTVGAVALDRAGNLAAATSTGGMTGKMPGRVGDSPIIGAGTYANNASCAVSATGHGEYFIRSVVAHDICALIEYRGVPLETAAREVLHGRLMRLGAQGGVIAIDGRGRIVMDFSSEGMFRAARDSHGRRVVMIYRDR